jgi:ZIP family zinc transporter
MNTQALVWALGGVSFIFLMTSLGSATVLLFRRKTNETVQKIFLGFAAGVMVAASVWSLLIPAIEESEAAGTPGWIPAAGGFALGVFFLMALDRVIPHLHPESNTMEGLPSSLKRTTLLVSAVTLHNIP